MAATGGKPYLQQQTPSPVDAYQLGFSFFAEL
jgi:hypothetical protein